MPFKESSFKPEPQRPTPSTAPPPKRFKVNLLSSLPLTRAFLRGEFFPEKLNHGFTKYAFAVVRAFSTPPLTAFDWR